MDLIGAGLSRTGTMSTQAALERLGYPCYHMTEVGRARGHLDIWRAFLADQSEMDWANLIDLMQEYRACVDTPCCLFYAELMAAFPAARVLLNVRDADKWYDSLISLSSALEEFRPLTSIHPRLAKFFDVTDAVGMKLTNGDLSRDACIDAFHRHNEDVQSLVPSDQLLVFRVEDGWEPLCEFLGQKVPREPFPYLNEGRSTIHQFVRENLLVA